MKSLTRGINHNTHPGEVFSNQILIPNRLTIQTTANLLGVSRSHLSNIINAKTSIRPLMAIRISKVFGGNATFWIRLQNSYDLRKAEKEFEEDHIKLNKFEYVE